MDRDRGAVSPGGRSSDPDPSDTTASETGANSFQNIDIHAQQIPSPATEDIVPAPSAEHIAISGPIAEAIDALDRAQADRELFELAREHDANGPVWGELAAALSAYAWNVLDPWISCGEIYTKVARRFITLELWPMVHKRLSVDTFCREEIIAHTIARTLDKLRTAIRAGRGWDPRKGLALRSYFITGCLYEFVYVVRKEHQWWTTHAAELPGAGESTEAGRLLWGSRLSIDPADIVTNRVVLFQHLAALSPEDRKVLWAHALGYSHAEIAHLFCDTTPKAIERRLHKIRQHARLSVRNR